MKLEDILELQKKVIAQVEEQYRQMQVIITEEVGAQVDSTLSTFGCLIDRETLRERGIKVVYASSPITTGLAMYAELEKAGVKSLEELKVLKPDIRKELMKRNIEDGRVFGNEILSHNYPLVIVPGSFFNRNFTQEHYMGVWGPIIRLKSDIVAYNTNFHYSDGCVEEFFIGLEAGKELRGRDSFKALNPREELAKLERAMNHVYHIIGKTPPGLHKWHQKIGTLV